MSVIMQAVLVGLIVAFGEMGNYFFGASLINDPIVLGPLVGFAMGNPVQGTIIGATLEVFFIGAVSIGAYIPPETVVGGVLATAFAISTGKGAAAAVAISLPIAMLALVFKNFTYSVLRPMVAKLADKYAENAETSKIQNIHMLLGFINVVFFAFISFLAFWFGNSAMQSFLNMIPSVVTDGMTIAAAILPGIGFAMLAKTIMSKKIVPFFFLGFVLSAYFKIPVLGIAIIGLILIFAWMYLQPQQAVKEESTDDDF